jgi:hypothetical protein
MSLHIEPEWWGLCREMKAAGFSYRQIARLLERNLSSISYCLSDKARADAKEKSRIQHRQGRTKPKGPSTPDDLMKAKLRRLAKEEFLESRSNNLDELRSIRRRYGCH